MTRPRLSLAMARRLSTHAAALAAFAATTTGGEIPLPFLAVFLIGWALSLAKGDRRVRGLPAILTVVTAGFGLVVLFGVAQGGVDLVLGATLFAGAICLNRLLARASAADDPLLMLTTLLLLAAGAALSGEATYGVCFAAYGTSATLALTFSHLERAADQAGASVTARDALLSRSLWAALGGLSLVALGGAAVIFVLFPRVNAQWISRHSGSVRAPAVGFANRVELGGVGTLRSDPRPALRVHFPDYADKPLPRDLQEPGSERLAVLWRGQALDTFDGHSWSASAEAEKHRKPLPRYAKGGYALHVEVEVLPVVGGQIFFTPGEAKAGFPIRHPGQGFDQPLLAIQKASGDVVLDRPPRGSAWEYEAWTAPIEASKLRKRGTRYPPEIAARDLQLPPGFDPRIAALARQWTAGLTDPVDQAEALVGHLRREYHYTSRLPGAAQDPVTDFLFTRKEGHCEFFSTAMALMLRSLGVPAREVTGFSGGVRAPGDDYYIVHAGDAHSWVELYVPEVGFVSFDPTPPTAAGEGPQGLRAWLAELGDELSERWRKAVVDYDLTTQVEALRTAGAALSRAADRFSRDPEQPGRLGLRLSPALKLLGALAAILGLLVLVRRWRRPRPAPVAEATLAFEAVQAALARRGVSRPPSETARELAARLEREQRHEATPVRDFAALYEAARFAGQPWGEPERARVRALLSELRRAR